MVNYDYLINSSLLEINEGIQRISDIYNSELFNSTFIDYLVLYSEKILECTFNKFRNDDYDYLKPCIVYYNNAFKFVPIELKESIEKLLGVRDQLLQNHSIQRIKVRSEK